MSEIALILINEADGLDQLLLLLPDDFHRIDAGAPVSELVQRILALAPISLQLVIITRPDPSLVLVDLCAKWKINEIRMLDLRFHMTEARKLLESGTGFAASEDALANLDHELEGWVAGCGWFRRW